MSDVLKILTSLGGNEWQREDKHRIYFNEGSLRQFLKLEISRYGTGNISNARYNGEHISNSQAKKILNSVPLKLWYDFADQNFHWQGGERATALDIVNQIRAKLEG